MCIKMRYSLLAVLLVLVSAVSAVTVEELSLTNCKLGTSAYACDTTITASCTANTTVSTSEIYSVKFTINGYVYSGTRISGNVTDGVWQVNVTNNYLFADEDISLEYVSGSTTLGKTCSASSDTDLPSGCYIRFSTPRDATNTCSCTYTPTTGAAQIDNTKTTTYAPSEGCADTNVYTTTSFYDYCDPGWVASYSACSLNAGSLVEGKMIKTYAPSNTDCCTQTASAAGHVWFNHNTGSDCDPPIDNGVPFACSISPYSQEGSDVHHSYEGVGLASFNTEAYKKYSDALGQSDFNPLVWDFDGDGDVEIITLKETGGGSYAYVTLYDNELNTLDSDTQTYTTFTGDAAIVGVTKLGDGTVVISDGNETYSVLVPVIQSGVGKMAKYNVTGTTLTFDGYITISSSANGYTGVTCFYDLCYFADTDNVASTMYSYDAQGGVFALTSYPAVNQQYSGGWAVDTNWRALNDAPIFIENMSAEIPMLVFLLEDQTDTRYKGAIIVDYNGPKKFHSFSWDAAGYPSPYAVTEYNIMGMTAIDRTVLATTEQVANASGTNKVSLGTQTFIVADSISDYSGDSTSTPQWSAAWPARQWLGTQSSEYEGISRPISDGTHAYFKLSVLSPSEYVGGIYDTPTKISSFTPQPNLLGQTYWHWSVVDSDFEYLWTFEDGFNVLLPNLLQGYRLNDGVLVANFTLSGYLNTHYNLLYSEVSDEIYSYYTYTVVSTNSYMQDVDVSSPSSPSSVVHSLECLSLAPPSHNYWRLFSLLSASSSLNIPMLTGIQKQPYSCLSGSPYPFSFRDLTSDYLPLAQDSLYRYINSTTAGAYPAYYGQIQGYDDEKDLLYLKDAILTGTRYGTISNRTILPTSMYGSAYHYGGVFNFDYDNPRYINTNNQKVKIDVSGYETNTFTFQTTTSSCDSNFIPVIYNSDDYILGIINQTPYIGAFSRPQWGYCDFSDEALPRVVSLNIPFEGYATRSCNATICNFTLNSYALSSTQRSTDHTTINGSGDWYMVIYGQDWEFGSNKTHVYQLDGTREPALTTTNAYSSAIRLDPISGTGYPIVTIANSVVGIYNKESDVSYADGVLYSSEGVYDFSTNTYSALRTGTNSKDENTFVIDVNSDGTADLLTMGLQSAMNLYQSTPDASTLLEGDLAVRALTCSQVPGTNNVLFRVAASAPNPDSISVSINPGDGRGYITQSVTSANGMYYVPYANSGTYDATVKVFGGSAASASATCEVQVEIDRAVAGTDCSFGYDGEFEYSDSVINHGWSVERLPTDTSPASVRPFDGVLPLWSAQMWIFHKLSNCGYAQITAEAKVYPGMKNTVLQLVGSNSEVAGIRMHYPGIGELGFLYDESGALIGQFNFDLNTPSILAITIDRANGFVYYYKDGVQLSSILNKTFSVVSVKIGSGGSYDYVRTSVSGGKLTEARGEVIGEFDGDISFLFSCDPDLKDAATLEERQSYVNVEKYCNTLDNGYCGFSDLAVLSGKFPECTKELFNYCAFKIQNSNENTGISRGTTCSALLTGSALLGQTVVPTIGGFWSIIVNNLMYVVIFLVILVVVGVVVSLGRRR